MSACLLVALSIPVQQGLQHSPRVRTLNCRNFFRRAARHHAPTLCAALWPKIDNVIRALDYVEVVFDHDHSVTYANQTLQHVEQFMYVCKVQTGRRFVKDVNGTSRGPLRKFFR